MSSRSQRGNSDNTTSLALLGPTPRRAVAISLGTIGAAIGSGLGLVIAHGREAFVGLALADLQGLVVGLLVALICVACVR